MMVQSESLLSDLPTIQGRYIINPSLKEHTWFKVGGSAPFLFKPKNTDDLCHFMKNKGDLDPFIMGMGSNILVRDGGIDNPVIRLMGESFSSIQPCSNDSTTLIVGAGCLDRTLAMQAADMGIGGFEFLIGIPGTLGGGLFMNAGAYGFEIKDIFQWAECVDNNGNCVKLTRDDLTFDYRHTHLPPGYIITQIALKGHFKSPEFIHAINKDYLLKRDMTQPTRAATGGSTFKNPLNNSAWKLIDAAGCRHIKRGGAELSSKHCNFMINTGDATADDLELLGEEIRQKVFDHSGIMLQWEIVILGHKPSLSIKDTLNND
jgi:UDP-N-acetylmuramate dehydrogenase